MNLEEAIKQFLPKYLSKEDQKDLLDCLDQFPENLNSKFYTTLLKNEKVVFQGDGMDSLPISDLPKKDIKEAQCLISSNTCDIALDNNRVFFEPRLAYSPIVKLSKYVEFLEQKSISSKKIKSHLDAIKNQKITQIFYLPKSAKIDESIVFLDRINNCSLKVIDKQNIETKRLFTLSNYGFYLFLLKLSISFTRIAEKVNRKIP